MGSTAMTLMSAGTIMVAAASAPWSSASTPRSVKGSPSKSGKRSLMLKVTL